MADTNWDDFEPVAPTPKASTPAVNWDEFEPAAPDVQLSGKGWQDVGAPTPNAPVAPVGFNTPDLPAHLRNDEAGRVARANRRSQRMEAQRPLTPKKVWGDQTPVLEPTVENPLLPEGTRRPPMIDEVSPLARTALDQTPPDETELLLRNTQEQAQRTAARPILGMQKPDPIIEGLTADMAHREGTVSDAARGLVNEPRVAAGKTGAAMIYAAGDALGNEIIKGAGKRLAQRYKTEEENLTPHFDAGWANDVYSGLKSTVDMATIMALTGFAGRGSRALITADGVPAAAAARGLMRAESALPGASSGLMTAANLAPMVGMTAGDSYIKYRERGASPMLAAAGAIGDGFIEYFTEKMPMKVLVDKLGKVGFKDFLAEFIGKEMAGEQMATALQDAVDTAVANPNKTWVEYAAERPSAALSTAIAVFTQTAVMGGANALLGGRQKRAGQVPAAGTTTPPPAAEPRTVMPPAGTPPGAEPIPASEVLGRAEPPAGASTPPPPGSAATGPGSQPPTPSQASTPNPADVRSEADKVRAAGIELADWLKQGDPLGREWSPETEEIINRLDEIGGDPELMQAFIDAVEGKNEAQAKPPAQADAAPAIGDAQDVQAGSTAQQEPGPAGTDQGGARVASETTQAGQAAGTQVGAANEVQQGRDDGRAGGEEGAVDAGGRERGGRVPAAEVARGAEVRGQGEGVPAEGGAGQSHGLTEHQQRIEAAREQVDTEPSEGKKRAGNYDKGHHWWNGLNLSIENPLGSIRKGVRKGKEWASKLAHDYGYIRGTIGKDKDHIDHFMGPNPDSTKVFVIDQKNPDTGLFDEHKIMLGFDSIEDARAGYLANYPKGWRGLQEISETDVDGLKRWLASGNTQRRYSADKVGGADALETHFAALHRALLTTVGEARMKPLYTRLRKAGGAVKGNLTAEQLRKGIDVMTEFAREMGAGPGVQRVAEAANLARFNRGKRSVDRSSASMLDDPSAARKALGLSGKTRVRELGEAFAKAVKRWYGEINSKDTSEESARIVAAAVADEVLYQLKNPPPNGSGLGWYSHDFPKALRKLAKFYPELATSKDARTVMTALIAITSNGERIKRNIAMARSIYEVYRSGGDITKKVPGTKRTKPLARNLKIIKTLIDARGVAGMRKYLLAEMTVSDMNAGRRAMGLKAESSYPADMRLPRAALFFGPKLGAFFANLSGAHGYLTMDLWWTRSIGRIRGSIVPEATSQAYATMHKLLYKEGLVDFLNTAREEIEFYAGAIWHGFSKGGYKNGSPIEKAANNLIKPAWVELNEAPERATERKWMYRVGQLAVAELAKRGHKVTMADLQAALWYYEKRLYKALGIQGVDDYGYVEALNEEAASDSDRPARSVASFNRRNGARTVAGGGSEEAAGTGGQDSGSGKRRVAERAPHRNRIAEMDVPGGEPRKYDDDDVKFERAAWVLAQMARDETFFSYADSDATTLAGVAKDMDVAVEVSKNPPQGSDEVAAYTVTLPAPGEGAGKGRFYVYELKDGTVYVNLAGLKSGKSGGALAYQMVAQWAANAGLRFVGDPADLSTQAHSRRAEAMLSAALRAGTTKYMEPHELQILDGLMGDENALDIDDAFSKWRTMDDLTKLGLTLRYAYGKLLDHAPADFADVRYDFANQRFYHIWDSTKALEPAYFAELAARKGLRSVGGGSRTLRRAAIVNTVLHASDREAWAGILAELRKWKDGGVPPALAGLAYNKGASGPLSFSPLAAVKLLVNIRSRWGNPPPIKLHMTRESADQAIALAGVDTSQPENRVGDDVKGFYLGGVVHIIVPNFEDERALMETLAHESVGHYGVRAIMGEQEWQALLKDIEFARKTGNKTINQLWDSVLETHGNRPVDEMADEVISRATEHAVDKDGNVRPGYAWFGRVLRAVAQGLRKLGFRVPFTGLELAGIISKAARNIEGGKLRMDGLPITHTGANPRLNRSGPMPALTPTAMVDTKSEAFKNWFGNSAAVDEKGNPLRLYHGTEADFSFFKMSRDGSLGAGIYLTPDPSRAAQYAEADGANIMPVYAALQNPLVIEHARNRDPMIAALEMLGMPREKAINLVEKAYERSGYISTQVMKRAREWGYDGIMQVMDGKLTEVVAWSNVQVKSAITNTGEFQKTAGDIRFNKSVKSKPGVNAGRIVKILGPSLYGDLSRAQAVTVKELFQNAFDAARASVNNGESEKGVVRIWVDGSKRLVRMLDNGVGMKPKTLATTFLTIAGTGKEGGINSGGFGFAKAQFLLGNDNIRVLTARDGKVAELKSTGEELSQAMNDPRKSPDVLVRDLNELPNSDLFFPDGHGTMVEVTIPEKWTDPTTGEEKDIEFRVYPSAFESLNKSPLFSNVEVYWNGIDWIGDAPSSHYLGRPLNIGANFPIDEYIPLMKVDYAWGSAMLYATREKQEYPDWQNLSVLSNGIFQFGMRIVQKPSDMHSGSIPYNFYLDINPKAKPEDPGYPFSNNRQDFSTMTKEGFGKLIRYINAMYASLELANDSDNFGQVEPVTVSGGKVTRDAKIDLSPKQKYAGNTFSNFDKTSKVELRDGRLVIDGKELPELTLEKMAKDSSGPTNDELKIDQSLVPANKVLMHDNMLVQTDSGERGIIEHAREIFGDDFDRAMYSFGNAFIKLRNLVARTLGYTDLAKEGIGISFDKKYRGVSIKIPFSGMFLNPGGPATMDKEEMPYAFYGTMVHELAHFRERNHAAEFAAEMQKILFSIESRKAKEVTDIKQQLISVVNTHYNIFEFLQKYVDDPNSKSRGKRFPEHSDERRDVGLPERPARYGEAGSEEPGLRGGAGEGAQASTPDVQSQGTGGTPAQGRSVVRFNRSAPAKREPTFYSALARTVEKAPFNKKGEIDAKTLAGWLQSRQKEGAFKRDELEWSGVLDWLALAQEAPDPQYRKVSLADAQDFLKKNGVQVEERLLGGVESDYAEPRLHTLERRWLGPDPNNDEGVDPGEPGYTVEEITVESRETGDVFVITHDMDAGNVTAQGPGGEFIPVTTPMNRQDLEDGYQAVRDWLQAKGDTGGLPADVDGPAKFAGYTIPGGENYRELLLTLPTKVSSAPDALIADYNNGWVAREGDGSVVKRGFSSAEEARAWVDKHNRKVGALAEHEKYGREFRSQHWEDPNVLAHIRFNERTDADGKRVLFIEEIQSDWAQKGRKEGFGGSEEPAPERPSSIPTYWSIRETQGRSGKAQIERIEEEHRRIVQDLKSRGLAGSVEKATAAFGDRWPKMQEDWRLVREYMALTGGAVDRPLSGDPVTAFNRYVDGLRTRVPDAFAGITLKTRKEWTVYNENGQRQTSAATRDEAQERAIGILHQANMAAWNARRQSRIPNAPFVTDTKAWTALALKRAIRWAVDNGFDRVAWTTGEQQAQRYDLSKQVSEIHWGKSDNGYSLSIKTHSGMWEDIGHSIPADKLPDYIGKDASQKVSDSKEKAGALTGLDLKVGGEGMRAYYDKIVPNVANDILKRVGGGKVGSVIINVDNSDAATRVRERSDGTFAVLTGADNGTKLLGVYPTEEEARKAAAKDGTPHPGFDITPAMKDSVPKGLPLFNRGTTPSLSPVPKVGLLDAALRWPGRLVARYITQPVWARVSSLADRYVPDKVKHGLVSDYGLPEPYLDAKMDRQVRINQMLRSTHNLINQLQALDRQQARLAHIWMSESPDLNAESDLLASLPEESRKTMIEMKQMVDRLGQEAVALGLLEQETYDRNKLAYLHRSYKKHEADLSQRQKMLRARSIAIRGDQFKGRGLRDDVTVGDLQYESTPFAKGNMYKRLEMRDPTPDGSRGKLRQVIYWPASRPTPPMYTGEGWRVDGIWEARFEDGDKVGMWRDFTREERQMMGEIDEVRYAFGQTMLKSVKDIETARFLKWVADNHAVATEADVAAKGGTVVAGLDKRGAVGTFGKDDWVEIPSTKIPGTNVRKYGALAGRYVPGAMFNDLRQIVNRIELGQAWQKLLQMWKVSKTGLSPAVHTNNIMSNFVMADLADVRARDIARALKLIIDSRKDEDAKRMIERFSDSGGDLGNFAHIELGEEIEKILMKELDDELNGMADQQAGPMGLVRMGQVLDLLVHGKLRESMQRLQETKLARGIAWPFRTMKHVYGQEDTVFRLAKFLKAVEEGASDRDAGKQARDAFLNYEINAPWVNAARQTALPFIAFSYRAIPMLVKAAVDKPWKFAKYAAVAGGLNALAYAMLGGGDDEEKERRLLPDELKGKQLGIFPRLLRMPWNDKNGSPIFLDVRRWVPAGDVFETNRASAWYWPSFLTLGGPLAMVVETASNTSLFTGQKLTKGTDTPGEMAAKLLDYQFKFWMPNLPIPNPIGIAGERLIPGIPVGWLQTYSASNIMNAAKGKVNDLGQEREVPYEIGNAFGVKLRPYPSEQLLINARKKMQAEVSDLDKELATLRRQYRLKGIDEEQFDKELRNLNEKKRDAVNEFREKAGLSTVQ